MCSVGHESSALASSHTDINICLLYHELNNFIAEGTHKDEAIELDVGTCIIRCDIYT